MCFLNLIFNILDVKSSTHKSDVHFIDNMWHYKIKVKPNVMIIMIVTYKTHFMVAT